MAAGKATTPPARTVVGNEALAALAVPARLAILNHLLAAGPRTASQCADVTGETASNCSWHLRALAKVGLVEPAESLGTDGRTRPWQAAAVGFSFAGDDSPAGKVAQRVIAAASDAHDSELFQRFSARQDLLPEEWSKAAGSHQYSLNLTPPELIALIESVDALIRPYVRPIRGDAPKDSQIVHLSLRAFLNPDVYGGGADPS
ncbi:MAG: helix-turn-helix transcriptional regulator [Geodermatophilaceae bacterium]|nr:helix-turn-helix transcriptional regulator [Geodermatophilaceae bacterium]